MVCQSDSSVFVLIVELIFFLILWWNATILNSGIAPIKCTSTVVAWHCGAFRYLGLKVNQSSTEIILDQID